MSGLFGTDGIRGIANEPPLDPTTVVRIGQCLIWYQQRRGLAPRLLLARDTRLSGPMLEAALVAGICAAGGEPLLAGILPTPALARLALQQCHCEGVMISASHNPWWYNGIKIVGADGFKWSQQDEDDFEVLLRSIKESGPEATATGAQPGHVGIPQPLPHAAEWYVTSLLQALNGGGSLAGVRMVVDCAHGAAVTVAAEFFQRCGAAVTILAAAPNGRNINENSGSLFPEGLREAVIAHGSDVGVAFDGDADRVVLVDETGTLLDGDQILWILARHLKEQGVLKRPVVVGTVMTNLGLERSLASCGIQLVRASVGDRYVVEKMRQLQAQLGGEPSGHIVWLDHTTTADGLLTALAVLQVAVVRQCPLSRLRTGLELFPQIQMNVEVANPHDVLADGEVQRLVQAAQQDLKGAGRVVARASGTEPLVRILLEGEDVSTLRLWSDRIASQVRSVGSKVK